MMEVLRCGGTDPILYIPQEDSKDTLLVKGKYGRITNVENMLSIGGLLWRVVFCLLLSAVR